jgi:hypothetical protein
MLSELTRRRDAFVAGMLSWQMRAPCQRTYPDTDTLEEETMRRRNKFPEQIRMRQQAARQARADTDQDKATPENTSPRRPLFHNPKRRPYWK